jgi:predicted nucleic acid-binding protein
LTLDWFVMFGQGMPEKCAENYRALRKKGITVRRTTDVIIATFCIEQRVPLLYIDRHFTPFADHLGLIPVLPEI